MGVVVQHCTAHWNERLTIDGKLSVAKIVSQHPTLAELFEEGLDFYVWKAEAEVEFPELPDLAQRALNAKYSVQQGQDIFQVFLRAVACWQSGVVDGKADKSLWIVRDIMKANPKCTPAECESMVEIARKFGGSSPTMISQVRLFLSTFKQPGQTVPAATLKAMANLKLAPEEMCPLFMSSILMLLASAPLHVITGGDIKSIMSKKDSKIPTMQLVEPMIKSMIDLSETMDVPSDVAAKIVGEFRTTLVLKFFQKVKKLDDDTFEVLASKVFSKMLPHGKVTMENPWSGGGSGNGKGKKAKGEAKKDIDNDATHQSSVPASSDVVECRDGKATGLHVAILNKKGFKEGELVKLKETG